MGNSSFKLLFKPQENLAKSVKILLKRTDLKDNHDFNGSC
jgi:hypothetical protein